MAFALLDMEKSKAEYLRFYQDRYAFMANLPNVKLNFGPVQDENKHPYTQVYLSNILEILNQEEQFGDFQFYIISSRIPWDFHVDEHSVVFYMANENHDIPKEVLAAHSVFTPYYSTKNRPENVFPIPLGYNGSLRELPLKPLNERSIDVFFSGNLHRRRGPFFLGTKLFLWVTQLAGKKYHLHIRFGRQFGGGFSPDEYSRILMDTKIALVPEGYLSNNSFRFFEATKYGTIVVTKRLYNYWFYKNFPGYQVGNWFGVGMLLNRLLRNPAELKKTHEAILAYYQNQCSESAVAQYIWQKIRRHK